MKERPRISIALCTYNGERCLKEQLESIAHQTLPPYELVACDDASTDSTIKILENFSHNAPFPVKIFHNENNLGLIKNFSQAAGLCAGDYIAFSDQDDIWLPDKLSSCYDKMNQAEQKYGSDIPLLVHSDLCVIDSENRFVDPSYLKLTHVTHVDLNPLKILLVRNFVLGCASLCNQALMKKCLPFPDVFYNHDGWCALIAACCGRILFIPDAKVLYRVHESNVTAWSKEFSHLEYIKSLLTIKLTPDRDISTMLSLFSQTNKLHDRLKELSCEIPPYLPTYIHALRRGGIINAARVMCAGIRSPWFSQNLLFLYRLSRGRHVKLIKE